MSIANEFYLIAHTDANGQPRLHPKAAGFGHAAALLAELCMLDRLAVNRDGVWVLSTEPPQDLLLHRVLDQITAEPQRHPVRDWLTFLGMSAVEDIAERMARQGVLEKVESRKLFGGSQRKYLPASLNDAAWPVARITARLIRRDPMEPEDQVLAGLASATNLTRGMLWDDVGGASTQYLRMVIAGLPESYRMLVAETEVAVSKAAATRT